MNKMKIHYFNKISMVNENKNRQIPRKQIYMRVAFLAICFFLLLYLYYIFVESGANPFLTVFILLFISMLILGLFFRKNSRSLYSRMFPVRKKTHVSEKTYRVIEETEIESAQPKIFKPIKLNTKYYKPIVSKCNNCGNLLPNFVKQCPFCNKKVKF